MHELKLDKRQIDLEQEPSPLHLPADFRMDLITFFVDGVKKVRMLTQRTPPKKLSHIEGWANLTVAFLFPITLVRCYLQKTRQQYFQAAVFDFFGKRVRPKKQANDIT